MATGGRGVNRSQGTPSVCVLLTTCNGRTWLDEQLDSILGQTGVVVQIVASDDDSSDGTRDWLQQLAAVEPRLHVLPHAPRFGSAAANFYRLMRAADTARFGLFAFADQDDIWDPDKIARHAALLDETKADGVSSDVTAFWPSGRTRLIRKSQPQRRYDYLFEAPGPGCTFLMRAALVRRCAELLGELEFEGLTALPYHDWFVYLVARHGGGAWAIDDHPSLRYRQHGGNEVGANVGWRAALRRLRMLSRGEYRAWVQQAMQIALLIDERAGRQSASLELSLLDILLHGRRRPRDAFVAALFMLQGLHAKRPSTPLQDLKGVGAR
jgi:rhamnosyltransferase